MDPHKLGTGIGSPGPGSTRQGLTLSSLDPVQPSYIPQHSLPSIRQLHPYLPLSGFSQPPQNLGESSNLVYSSSTSQIEPQPGTSTQSLLGPRRSSEMLTMDSELEDVESREPPKKKRRRQALSCTGEHTTRQSVKDAKSNATGHNPAHLVLAEGSNRGVSGMLSNREKYVTRAEFDELKARYDELFEQVRRLQALVEGHPYLHMTVPAGLQTGEPPVDSLGYQPMIAPSQPYNLSPQPQGPQRFIKPEDTQTRSRHHQSAIATSPALSSSPLRHPLAKKLPRADARAGAASAPRISGSKRPSGSFFRDDTTTSLLPVTGSSSEMYLANPNPISSSSQTTAATQVRQPSRRVRQSSRQLGEVSRDDDRESLAHFMRDR
ncbi:hypothetical protein H0H92_006947 [Tricholoma furcatifolium]|nr:hypothetical protein H0H92_006947 [Tricholoma furcatifolium]